MKKESILGKMTSGKGFYITSAVCFVLIIAAIAVIYNSSIKILRNIAPETTINVEKNKDDVKDPRVTTSEEETTTKKEELKTTNEMSTIPEKKEPESTFVFDTVFNRPIEGEMIKAFSQNPVYDKTMEDWRSHGGTDYKAEENGKVNSVGKGMVTKVISDVNYGYIIEIDHGDFTGRYCGLKQGSTVKIGDTVEKGQEIGEIGEIPAEKNDGLHLHFEVLIDGDRVDPETKFQ